MSGPIKYSLVIVVLAGLTLAGPWHGPVQAARPMVKKIETKSEEGKFTLRVFLTAQLAPRIFNLSTGSKKPKVVVDFEKATGPKSLPARIDISSAMVRAVRVGLHKGAKPKVRLVLDLVPGYLYLVEQWFRRDINSFILVLTAK